MTQTGLMITIPSGTKFWYPCPDGRKMLAALAKERFVFGAGWPESGPHPDTRIEFGTSDGVTFTPSETLHPQAA